MISRNEPLGDTVSPQPPPMAASYQSKIDLNLGIYRNRFAIHGSRLESPLANDSDRFPGKTEGQRLQNLHIMSSPVGSNDDRQHYLSFDVVGLRAFCVLRLDFAGETGGVWIS